MSDHPTSPGASPGPRVSDAPRDSALSQAGLRIRRHDRDNLSLAEVGRVTLARVQTLDESASMAKAFADCGVPLPTRVNTCAGQDPSALCLAPREWLLFSEFLDFERLSSQVAPATENRQSVIVDQTFAFAVFRVSGKAAPWLLQKHCGLDLCRGVSEEQHCARTKLDHAEVMLHYHQPGSSRRPFGFDLIFDRGLARYVWQLLLASAPHAEELFERYGIPA